MSSRFVSAGSIGPNGDVSKDAPSSSSGQGGETPRNKEWEAVQQELEAERRRREEQRVKAASGEGERSLYEVLQANKAAKEAEFAEQSKLSNQFRALDDDEIEFLDEVRAKKRREEEAVRRETEDGLRAFREQQKRDRAAERGAAGPDDGDDGAEDPAAASAETESWGTGARKRKRAKEREGKGLLRRKVSAGPGAGPATTTQETGDAGEADVAKSSHGQDQGAGDKKEETKPPEKKGLGLVGYSSESDSDDE